MKALLEMAWQNRRSNSEKAYEILGTLKPDAKNNPQLYHNILTIKGILYIYETNYDAAKEVLQEAEAYYQNHSDPVYASRNANNLGILYMIWGKLDTALAKLLQGLEISRPHHVDEMTIFLLYNIAEIYKDINYFSKAIPMLKEAIALNKNHEHVLSCTLLSSIAYCYHKAGQTDLAKEYANESQEISRNLDDEYSLGLSYVFLSNLYLDQLDITKALDYCQRSIDLRIDSSDKFTLINSYITLAKIQYAQKKLQASLKTLDKANALIEQYNSDIVLNEVYEYYAKIYRDLGDYEASARYYEMFIDFVSEHYNDRLDKTISIISAENEIESIKKDAEIYRLNNVELKQAIEKLETTQADLIEAERLAGLGKLVAGVAHELNTPIGSILTLITSQKKGLMDLESNMKSKSISRKKLFNFITKGLDVSHNIESAVTAAAEMINSFKTLAVPFNSLKMKEVNNQELMDLIIHNNDKRLKMNQVTFTHTSDSFQIKTYPLIINRIFTQLIENSIKHSFGDLSPSEQDFNIQLVFKATDDFIIITYKDNGLAIPEDSQKFMFEPFYSTKKNVGHMGIGLNAVHNMVTQALKGKISYDKGYTIKIPRTPQ